MNKKILSALIGAAAIGFTTYGVNTMAATLTTASAAADIVSAIGISQTTGMNFGDISVGATGGTVILDTTNGVTVGGTDTVAEGGTVTSAVFRITGNNVAYAITMPTDITVTSGGNTMTINTYTYLADNAATTSNGGVIGATTSGQDDMKIGGTLTVSGGQVAGAYTGTYNITALYQ